MNERERDLLNRFGFDHPVAVDRWNLGILRAIDRRLTALERPARHESPAATCGTCHWWERTDPEPNALGICTLLSRRSGAVSTYLRIEGKATVTFGCGRNFGCVYHRPKVG